MPVVSWVEALGWSLARPKETNLTVTCMLEKHVTFLKCSGWGNCEFHTGLKKNTHNYMKNALYQLFFVCLAPKTLLFFLHEKTLDTPYTMHFQNPLQKHIVFLGWRGCLLHLLSSFQCSNFASRCSSNMKVSLHSRSDQRFSSWWFQPI